MAGLKKIIERNNYIKDMMKIAEKEKWDSKRIAYEIGLIEIKEKVK